jgi:hypothetical protein
MDNAIV